MRDIKGRLARGAIWLAATRAIVNLASFANTLLLARLLIPADFGLVALATTVTAIITSLTELSLASALIQHSDPDDAHFHTAWTLNLARSCLISLIIAALAVPVAHLYRDDRLVAIMLAISVTTLFSGTLNPKLIIFSRDLVFWQEFALGTSQRIAGLVAATLFAVLYRSYWALVASMVATQFTALVLSYILIPYRPRPRLTHVRELFSFSIWLSLAQVANTINYKFDQLAIGYLLGSGPLGFYTVGDNLAILPTREATTPLAQTLFPGFVQLAGDKARLRQAYQRAQSFLCALALPVGFIFALVAQPLIQLTMGPKWQPAGFIVQFLAGIFALQTLSSSLQPVAMALGRTRQLFVRDILILVVRLPSVMLGIYLDGMAGIVYARCVSGVISTLLNMHMVRQMLDLPISAQLAANRRSLVSVSLMMVIMSFICTGLNQSATTSSLIIRIAGLVAGGAGLYAGCLFAMWQIAGRPRGPESEVLHAISHVLTRLMGTRRLA